MIYNDRKELVYLYALLLDIERVFKRLGNCENFSLPNISLDPLDESEQKIINDAACLSLGENSTAPCVSVEKRLSAILQKIKEGKQSHWKHPVKKMELSKNYFPKESFATGPDYNSLWDEFIKEYNCIKDADSCRAFSETLLNLLYKFTSSVPYYDDISLYDHLKTTAALAVCLYDFQKKSDRGDDNVPFLLIGADFSGIQPYIYQIVSKYAGKNLKGRSFYLRLLSDAIVRYLLRELGLFQSNIVYNSGGGFYLLAPNTQFVKDKLKESIETIEKQLFLKHGTSLYVAIDYIELSCDALTHQNGQSLGQVWGELFVKRDKKKSTKYANYIKDNYGGFFSPFMSGGLTERDSITGEEFLQGEEPIKKENLLLKEVTAKQIEIGKKLRETNVLVVVEKHISDDWKKKYVNIKPADLGYIYYFLTIEELKKCKEELDSLTDKVSVITLNGKEGSCAFLYSMEKLQNIFGLDFYGGNEIDRKDVRTFEEMCKNDNFSRLGVLRMDVDNLGLIFQQGIPAQQATLSRYAALSRSFDFFFSGYLNTIWREVAPDNSFIIYSGGDDVFIVGSWEVTIELAERIRKDFAEFTCNNPAFSVSGGIAILSPKYPIMKGAEESAEEESAAKDHTCKYVNKNAISFMGMPMNWELEYPAIKELKNEIYTLLIKNKLPKSFVSKVLMHHANAGIVNHQITNVKTYWKLTYDLSRMGDRHQIPLLENCIKEVCKSQCNNLNGKDIETDYHPLELWAFAARWAELEYRTKKEEQNKE